MKKKIIAIVGPTASGKTSLSIELAKRLDGEVICCDSMQIYRGMDIGTAKPTADEMDGVPHHLVDIADTSENFSAADYAPMAKTKIEEIYERGKLPIFCGGTGLYLDCVVKAKAFEGSKPDPEYRDKLFEIAKEDGGIDRLHAMLVEVDPVSAEAIHKNNVKRVIRALEIYHSAGVPKSELDAKSREKEGEYDIVAIGLRYNDRETLYERINKRVDIMVESGLLAEVERLYAAGALDSSYTAAQAIGYKEFLAYLRGEMSLDGAIEELKNATRRYAKRQMTWFSARDYVTFIDVDKKSFDEIVSEAMEMIK